MPDDYQPQILTVGDFFLRGGTQASGKTDYQRLKKPDYQRPYEWTPKHVLTLLNDLFDFQREKGHRYRLGSIILYQNEENELEIVDGQQRLITLWLIRTCLFFDSDHSSSNPEKSENDAIGAFLLNDSTSQNAVRNAIVTIKDWLDSHASDKENLQAMLTTSSDQNQNKSVELVIIKVSNIEEAFQLFDSQNSRGKPLRILNYLKARHLGCMSPEEWQHAQNYGLFDDWKDDKDSDEMEILLNRLFKICEWSHRRTRTRLTIENMDHFFYGFTGSNYAYQRYTVSRTDYFEIGHPFKAGEEFFWMIRYFRYLSKRIDDYCFDSTTSSSKTRVFVQGGPLDNYTKLFIKLPSEDPNYTKDSENNAIWSKAELACCLELFRSATLLYCNRFGFDNLSDSVTKALFNWTLAPRYVFIRLRDEAIDDFASGNKSRERGLPCIPYFERMSEKLTTDFLYDMKQALQAVVKYRANPESRYSDKNNAKRDHIDHIINKQ